MKILLAVDGSEPSLTAASLVKTLSLPADSTIELMTVVSDQSLTYGPWPALAPIETPEALDGSYSDVRAQLDEIADGLADGGRTICSVVRHGRPATEIVMEADRTEADLIVIGARRGRRACPYGDYRPWDDITSWAQEIANGLRSVELAATLDIPAAEPVRV